METNRDPIQTQYIGDEEDREQDEEFGSEQGMSTRDIYEMDWSSVQTDGRRGEARVSIRASRNTDDTSEKQRTPSQYEKDAIDTLMWNIQHHANIIPSNEPTWSHINVPLKVERNRAAAEAFAVFHDVHERVSKTVNEWGMGELGNMVGAIAGGLMEADQDEISTLCEDEEHLIRRIQEIAPTIDRTDYRTELTDALGRLKHHLWKFEERPITTEEKGAILYHKVQTLAPRHKDSAAQITARMMHRDITELHALLDCDTMMKMRITKQMIDIQENDPHCSGTDPFGEAQGDFSNRSEKSLFAIIYARVEKRVTQTCFIRTHEIAMRVTAAMAHLGYAFMECVIRDDILLRTHCRRALESISVQGWNDANAPCTCRQCRNEPESETFGRACEITADTTDMTKREEEQRACDTNNRSRQGSENDIALTKYGTAADQTSLEEVLPKNTDNAKEHIERGQHTDDEPAKEGKDNGHTTNRSILPEVYDSSDNGDALDEEDSEMVTDTEDATSRKRQFNESGCDRSSSENGSSKQRRSTMTWTTSPSPIKNKRSCSSDSSSTAWKRRKPHGTEDTQQTEDSLEYDQIERMTSGDTSASDEPFRRMTADEEIELHKRGRDATARIRETGASTVCMRTVEDANRERMQRFLTRVFHGARRKDSHDRDTAPHPHSANMQSGVPTGGTAEPTTIQKDETDKREPNVPGTCQEGRGRYPAAYDKPTDGEAARETTKTSRETEDSSKKDGSAPSEAQEATSEPRRKSSTTSSISSTLSGDALLRAHMKRGPRIAKPEIGTHERDNNISRGTRRNSDAPTETDTTCKGQGLRMDTATQKNTNRRECEIASDEQHRAQKAHNAGQHEGSNRQNTQEHKDEHFWEPRTTSNTKDIMCFRWRISGSCALGDQCQYSHQNDSNQLGATKETQDTTKSGWAIPGQTTEESDVWYQLESGRPKEEVTHKIDMVMALVKGITRGQAAQELNIRDYDVTKTFNDIMNRMYGDEVRKEDATGTQGIRTEKKVDRIKVFRENTGTTTEEAKRWLNDHNGQLSEAIDAYKKDKSRAEVPSSSNRRRKEPTEPVNQQKPTQGSEYEQGDDYESNIIWCCGDGNRPSTAAEIWVNDPDFTPQITDIKKWVSGSLFWVSKYDGDDSMIEMREEKTIPERGDVHHLQKHRMIIKGIHVKWTRGSKDQRTKKYAKGGGWYLYFTGKPEPLREIVKLLDHILRTAHKHGPENMKKLSIHGRKSKQPQGIERTQRANPATPGGWAEVIGERPPIRRPHYTANETGRAGFKNPYGNGQGGSGEAQIDGAHSPRSTDTIRGLRPMLRRHNITDDEIIDIAKRCQWDEVAMAQAASYIDSRPVTHGEWQTVPKKKRTGDATQKTHKQGKGVTTAGFRNPYGNGQGILRRASILTRILIISLTAVLLVHTSGIAISRGTGTNGYRNPYGNGQPETAFADTDRKRGIAPVDIRRGGQGRARISVLGNPFDQGPPATRSKRYKEMLSGNTAPPPNAYSGCTEEDVEVFHKTLGYIDKNKPRTICSRACDNNPQHCHGRVIEWVAADKERSKKACDVIRSAIRNKATTKEKWVNTGKRIPRRHADQTQQKRECEIATVSEQCNEHEQGTDDNANPLSETTQHTEEQRKEREGRILFIVVLFQVPSSSAIASKMASRISSSSLLAIGVAMTMGSFSPSLDMVATSTNGPPFRNEQRSMDIAFISGADLRVCFFCLALVAVHVAHLGSCLVWSHVRS